MSSAINILLGITGTAAVLSGLNSVRSGLTSVGAEASIASASALGLGQFATVAGIAAGSIAGLKSALDFGGQETDLSARTGQSVRDLVILQRAFDTTGIGAGNVATTINRLQRMLGEIHKPGDDVSKAFDRLGVSMGSIKAQSAIDQIETLTAAFAKIENPSERAALAIQIFGISGGEMLQLFGDSHALSDAADDAAELASRMNRNASAFDQAGDRLSLLKTRLMDMAAAAIENMLPALDRVATVIKGLNLGGIGAVGGSVIPTLLGAFAGSAIITRLDNTVLDWATRAGGPMGQRLAAGLAPLTGLLSKLLPVGLFLAVAKAIIDGVTAAFLEADRQADDRAQRAAEAQSKRINALRNARSEAENASIRDAAQKRIAELDALAQRPIPNPNWAPQPEGFPELPVNIPAGLTPDQIQEKKYLEGTIQASNSAGAKAAIVANVQKDADAARLNAAKQIVEKLTTQADTYQKQFETAQFSLASEQQKLPLLDSQADKALELYLVNLKAATLVGDVAARDAARVQYEATLLEIAGKRETVEKAIADAKKKAADAETAAAEKRKQAELEGQRAAIDAAKGILENQQQDIQARISALDADFTRTDAAKWAERKALQVEAVAAADNYLKKMKELRFAASSEEAKRVGDTNVRGAQRDLAGTQTNLAAAGPDPNSLTDQMDASMTRLQNSWGTAAEGIANTITTTIGAAVSGISDGIYGWITGTSTWGQAMLQIGRSALKSVIDNVVQIGVQQLLNGNIFRTVMLATNALSDALRVGRVAKDNAAEAATLPLKTAGAAAAGISSYGVALAFGAIAIALIAAAAGGFDAGGYTSPIHGGGSTSDVAGVVHKKEWVAPAWMTTSSEYGPMIAGLEAARQGKPGRKTGGWLTAFAGPFYDPARDFGLKYLKTSDAESKTLMDTRTDAQRAITEDFLQPPGAVTQAAYRPPVAGGQGTSGSLAGLAGGGAAPQQLNIANFDDRQSAQQWLETQQGRRFFINLSRELKYEI